MNDRSKEYCGKQRIFRFGGGSTERRGETGAKNISTFVLRTTKGFFLRFSRYVGLSTPITFSLHPGGIRLSRKGKWGPAAPRSHMLSQFLESRRHEAQRIWGSAELRFLSLSGTWAKEVLCSRGRLNCTWVWKSIIRLNRLHSISAGSSIHYARIDEFFPFSGQFRLGHPLNWSRPPCLSLYFLLWIERFQDWLTRLTFFFCLTFHRPTY